MVISYFYTYKLPDIYAAKTQILLKSDNTYDYQKQLFKGLGYTQDYQDTYNQIRVLSSNDIIEKAVNKLKLDVSYFIVGRLKTTEVYESMPFDFYVSFISNDLYEEGLKFKILDVNHFQLTYKKDNKELSNNYPFGKEVVDNNFILTVKRNSLINDNSFISLKDNNYLIVVHNINNLVDNIKNTLDIQNIENTSILELTLEDQIPSRATTFLDTLSKVYLDYTAQNQITINENTLVNIDKQLTGVVKILDSIDSDLENYKASKEVFDISKQEDTYLDQLSDFNAQKSKLELWIESLEALEKYIITIGDMKYDKLLPPSFYIEEGDDYLKEAINEVYTLQMERNSRLFNSTEDNRNISEMDQKSILIKKNILTYIQNSKAGLKQKILDVEKQINSQTSIIKGLPTTEIELLNIQRKVDVNQKMYEFLLEQRASTIIARAGILPQTEVIESAFSVGIVRPNKRKIFYYFLLSGIVLSLVYVFVRSVMFSTIENIMELKRLTNLPVLGEILLSQEASEKYIIVDKDPKAAITESFRAIRTNLEYLASDSKSKVILITSYNPGEGKTFCSINLATIIAKAGKKVLIIEMDLHKPKVQKAFNMRSDNGVSTILIGKSEISTTILPTEIENLSVILSGPTPPNASEIILSKHLKELLDYARENFDYVIVDTPPIGLITDALVIMKNVDISIFVINSKYAKKHIVTIAQEIVNTNKLKNFALLLNGVKRTRAGYYYNYGYGYGYGYGRSYGGGSYGYGSKKKGK